MKPELQFVIGVIGCSIILTYIGWMRFRVWRFRQDLFAIRDRLWDEMREIGELDNPSHREFRDGLNALIRIAPELSARLIVFLLLKSDLPEISSLDSPELPQVTLAKKQTFSRFAVFLFGETISGMLMIFGITLSMLTEDTRASVAARLEGLSERQAFQRLEKQTRSASSFAKMG